MNTTRLWQRYQALPLSEQFKWEWIAFGVVALVWATICLTLAVLT